MVWPHEEIEGEEPTRALQNDLGRCPRCLGPVEAISLWYLRCRMLRCRHKIPRYDWVEPDPAPGEQIELFSSEDPQ